MKRVQGGNFQAVLDQITHWSDSSQREITNIHYIKWGESFHSSNKNSVLSNSKAMIVDVFGFKCVNLSKIIFKIPAEEPYRLSSPAPVECRIIMELRSVCLSVCWPSPLKRSRQHCNRLLLFSGDRKQTDRPKLQYICNEQFTVVIAVHYCCNCSTLLL